jgi:hypothetical protein
MRGNLVAALQQISSRTIQGGNSSSSSSSVGGGAGSSSSSSSSNNSSSGFYMTESMTREAQLQRLLPPGAFTLLQHWPAVQLELLMLVKDVEQHLWLLPQAAGMLQVCRLASMPVSDLTAVKRALIRLLLQLVLPRVQGVIKALRGGAVTQTSSSSSNSSSSSISDSGGGAQGGNSDRFSRSRLASHADSIERQMRNALLECLIGGELQLSCVNAQLSTPWGVLRCTALH